MKPAPTPQNEQRRQEAQFRSGILNAEPDRAFDDLVHLAAHACDVTMASISLLDRDREWLKAKAGLPDSEWSGDRCWCARPNLHQPRVILPNTLADHRSTNYPMVIGAPSSGVCRTKRIKKKVLLDAIRTHTGSHPGREAG